MNLSDILGNGNGGDYFDNWDTTEAAGDFTPIPAGKYQARWAKGELGENRNGTPEYLLEFSILDHAKYAGRKLWHPVYLTSASKPQAKRDFETLGIRDPKTQLEKPIPRGVRLELDVVVRKDDSGNTRNKVRSFKFIGIDPPKVDPFAPKSPLVTPGDDQAATQEPENNGL
ncbi:DUF669 domain-containing protein [Rosistilla oblonga]|uniref:DUF669 domain-containing protein n=1 Tax=Rosistilla oblonga TaxID=2527990 RepID=UPI003A980236